MKHAYLIIAHNEWPILRILLSMLAYPSLSLLKAFLAEEKRR